MDRTLILVKPDAFARGLTGEILARFERKGLDDRRAAQHDRGRELAERHYAEHSERPFFGELVDFITSGPIVAMVLEGTEAVKAARQVIGATNPLEATTGSIRGDFAIEMGTEHGARLGLRPSRPRARRPVLSRLLAVVAEPLSLVLASGSPQRRALLERLGVPFTIRAADARGARAGRRSRQRWLWRTRCARRAPRLARERRCAGGGARLRHDRGARRCDLRQAAPMRQAARETLAALGGARTR